MTRPESPLAAMMSTGNAFTKKEVTKEEPAEKKQDEVMSSDKEVIESKGAHKQTAITLESMSTNNVIYQLNTDTIRPWTFADRPESELTNIQELADDISENGQNSPIIVRKLEAPEGQIQYEFIYGNRRLTACRYLGITVKAIVKEKDELPDDKAFALMFGENEQREGISNWARSLSFKSILDKRIYKSQRELSRAIGKNEGYIKDLCVYQRIPTNIAQAIGPMTNVGLKSAREIISLSKNKENTPAIIEIAGLIGSGASPSVIKNKVLKRVSSKKSPKHYSCKAGGNFSISCSDKEIGIRFSSALPENFDPDTIAKLLITLADQGSKDNE